MRLYPHPRTRSIRICRLGLCDRYVVIGIEQHYPTQRFHLVAPRVGDADRLSATVEDVQQYRTAKDGHVVAGLFEPSRAGATRQVLHAPTTRKPYSGGREAEICAGGDDGERAGRRERGRGGRARMLEPEAVECAYGPHAKVAYAGFSVDEPRRCGSGARQLNPDTLP